MSLKDILDEGFTRLSAVKVASGFNTDIGLTVKRGSVVFALGDLPASCIYMPTREVSASSVGGKRSKTEPQLIIDAESTYEDHPLDAALLLLSDIQKALEIEPQDFNGLLTGDGLEWLSDKIYYPPETSNVVGVSVTYSIPHLRFFGDPTKPEVN